MSDWVPGWLYQILLLIAGWVCLLQGQDEKALPIFLACIIVDVMRNIEKQRRQREEDNIIRNTRAFK